MKPIHGFLLIFAWLTLEAVLWYFIPIPYVRLLASAMFAFAAMAMALSQTLERRFRVCLASAALVLMVSPLLYLGSLVGIEISYDMFDVIGVLRLAILALVALVLGFAATERRWNRFFILAAILALCVFLLGGMQWLAGLAVAVAVLVSLAIFLGFFGILSYGFWKAGEEDARLLREGKPPKYGPPPFGPNNPFRKN